MSGVYVDEAGAAANPGEEVTADAKSALGHAPATSVLGPGGPKDNLGGEREEAGDPSIPIVYDTEQTPQGDGACRSRELFARQCTLLSTFIEPPLCTPRPSHARTADRAGTADRASQACVVPRGWPRYMPRDHRELAASIAGTSAAAKSRAGDWTCCGRPAWGQGKG